MESSNYLVCKKYWQKCLFFAIALLYSCSFIFWRPIWDQYYYFNFATQTDDNIMIFLSMFVAKLWITLLGDEIILLRLLGWVFCMAGMMMPYFCLQEKKLWMQNLNYLSSAIVLLGYWSICIFNPDSITICLVSAIIVYSIKGNQKNLKYPVIIGLLTALLLACRLPNILMVPVIAAFIFLKNKLNGYSFVTNAKRLFVFFVVVLIAYVLLYSFIIGHFIGSEFFDSFSSAAESDQAHSIKGLLIGNFKIFWDAMVIFSMTYSVASFACIAGFGSRRTDWLKTVLPLLIVTIYLAVAFWYAGIELIGNYLSAASILLTCIFLYCAREKGTKAGTIIALYIILCALLASAGSDQGIRKMLPVLAVFAPLFFKEWSVFYDYKIVRSLIISFVIIAFISTYYRFPRYMCPVDAPNNALQWTSIQDRDETHGLLEDFTRYGVKDKTVFFGMAAHKMYHITQSRLPFKNSFWQTHQDGTIDVKKILQLIEEDKSYVVIVSEKNCIDFFDRKVLAMGFDIIETPYSFVIKAK